MLKIREPAEQQMGEPTELLTQRQSLVRRILMFPLTRLLIAAIVFELVVISVAILAITAMLILGQPHLVDLFVGSLSSTSNDSSPMSLILIFGLLAVAGIITLVFMGKVIEQRLLAEV